MAQLVTINVAQLVTIKMAKRGPISNFLYIYAVKLKTGPRFGGFKVKNWSKFKVKYWSKFFHCFPHFYSVFGYFWKHK